eukprot:TRINITY_DN16331_c0_g1_i1.p1 TRINITY_DN16331_c0_g1~~TRINITY_DN16331_c0_g1_i1.p1  ORF type:complete len:753 (+),score=235.17 TRINITY_DN16331_c0_g1_i1:229-2487(+)
MSVFEKQLQRPDGCIEIRANASLGLRPLRRYAAGRQTVAKKIVTLTSAAASDDPPGLAPPKPPRTAKAARKAGLDTGAFKDSPADAAGSRYCYDYEDRAVPAPRPRAGAAAATSTPPHAISPPVQARKKRLTVAPAVLSPKAHGSDEKRGAAARRRLRVCGAAVWAAVRLSRLGGDALTTEEQQALETVYAAHVAAGHRLTSVRSVQTFLAEHVMQMSEAEVEALLKRIRFFTDPQQALSQEQFLCLMRLGKRSAALMSARHSLYEAFIAFAPNGDPAAAHHAAIPPAAVKQWLAAAEAIGVAVDSTPFAMLLSDAGAGAAAEGAPSPDGAPPPHYVSYGTLEHLLGDAGTAADDGASGTDDGEGDPDAPFSTHSDSHIDSHHHPTPRTGPVQWLDRGSNSWLAHKGGARGAARPRTSSTLAALRQRLAPPGVRRTSSCYERHVEHYHELTSIHSRLAKLAGLVESPGGGHPRRRDSRRDVRRGSNRKGNGTPCTGMGHPAEPPTGPRLSVLGFGGLPEVGTEVGTPAEHTPTHEVSMGKSSRRFSKQPPPQEPPKAAPPPAAPKGKGMKEEEMKARREPIARVPLPPPDGPLLLMPKEYQKRVQHQAPLRAFREAQLVTELMNGAALKPSRLVEAALHESREHWQQTMLDTLSQPLPPIPPRPPREPARPLKLNKPKQVAAPYLRASFHTRQHAIKQELKEKGKREKEKGTSKRPRPTPRAAAVDGIPTVHVEASEGNTSPITCSQLLSGS